VAAADSVTLILATRRTSSSAKSLAVDFLAIKKLLSNDYTP
jgi:hypothetical protein